MSEHNLITMPEPSAGPPPPKAVRSLHSAQPVRLLLDRVLVIAFQAQRPDLDRDLLRNVRYHIKDYRERLARLGTPERPAIAKGYYRPKTYAVWGDYDFATFYMGDDLESVPTISNTAMAPSQEFLFGSPYAIGDELSAVADLDHLLGPEGPSLVIVSRVKLGDHLLAVAGGELRCAVARWVHERARHRSARAIVLRCWSWPDLIVVSMGKDPRELLALSREVEQVGLQDLMGVNGELEDAFSAALEHPVGRSLLSQWVFGRPSSPRGGTEVVSPREPADVLQELRQRDAAVAAKTQIAMPLPDTDDPLYDLVLQDVGEHWHVEGELEATRADVERLLADLRREAGELGGQVTAFGAFTARIVLQGKPGHAAAVHRFAEHLRGDLQACRCRLRAGTAGQSETTILELAIPPTVEGLGFLLRISVSFRVCPRIRSQLSMTETQLEWDCATCGEDGRTRPPAPSNRRTGYSLLTPATPPRAMEFQRRLTTRRRVGRVEALALQAWHTAVEQMTGRPEMFGAMIEVQKGATIVYRELLLHSDLESGPLLAQSVLEMGEYFQRAYQQRLQFSPVVSGAPPINGQLPFGVNQIVRMVDGLASVVTQAAFTADVEARPDPDLPARANVVFFDADPELGTMAIQDFGVLKLSLLQAMTPLSLTLLFHELGHLVVRRSFWHGSGRDYWQFMAQKRKWWSHRHACAQQIVAATQKIVGRLKDSATPDWFEPPEWCDWIEIFLEDIFAHAVWRRVGCGGDWKLFVTQFLAGAAMGIRTRTQQARQDGPHHPTEFIALWPTAVAHLAVQRILMQSGERTAGLRNRLGDDVERACIVAEMIREIAPFARGEYVYYRSSVGSDDSLDPADVEGEIRAHFNGTWNFILSLLKVAQDDDGYWEALERLFAILDRITARLDKEKGEIDSHLESIRHDIARGRPVESIQWSILQRDPGGCPAEFAILVAREILAGVTLHFQRVCQRSPNAVSVCRDRSMEYVGIGTGGWQPGVFVDFAGGLFATGAEDRLDYLRVRLAAVESLAALADRILAGPMNLRFVRQRQYLRTPDVPKDRARPVERTKLWLLDHRDQPSAEIEVIVIDQSPVGLGLRLLDGALHAIEEELRVEVEAEAGGERRSCVVRWVKPIAGALHFGVKKLPEESPTGSGQDEPAPEREMRWVRLLQA